jgi:hypothetical protein
MSPSLRSFAGSLMPTGRPAHRSGGCAEMAGCSVRLAMVAADVLGHVLAFGSFPLGW